MEVVSKMSSKCTTPPLGIWVMRLIIVLMVVAFPLRKEKSENGDTSGEQGEIALCLHSDSEGASEEEDHETSEQEDNYSGVESASSAEQEAALADSGEQARIQSPPNAQEDNVMEEAHGTAPGSSSILKNWSQNLSKQSYTLLATGKQAEQTRQHH